MPYNSLNDFIKLLEKKQQLIKIDYPVSTELEITEIADRVISKGGPALLFNNTGKNFPLLINAFGTEERMCLALGINNFDELTDSIQEIINEILFTPKTKIIDKIKLLSSFKKLSFILPKLKKGKGECQEIIMNPPDITKLPILKCWPYDGGPFITLPLVHTISPNTNIRNVGMYRMQVINNNSTGMHWHLHKGGAKHYEEYKEKNQIMPVVVTLGGDPVYTYVATAPLPDNVDEYLLAGFIRKKNVELVKCLTCNIEVPADVDFVIEGYIDPNEELIEEGPFGDHTGFYSLKEKYPIFHITCITHKRKAIYPTTIVGIPVKEDAFFAKATERIFLPLIKNIAPEIIDINMPPEGVFHNICIVKIKKHYPAQAIKVMNALWGVGQMMFNKYLIVIDQNTNINNYYEILKYISKNTVLPNNCIIVPGPLDILDHAVENIGIGSKMGIDATIKLESEEQQLLINNIPNTADNETIMNEFPDIININNLSQKIKLPIMIMCVKKLSHIDLKKLHYKIINSGLVNGIKFILYIDKTVDANNLPMVTWIASSNTIPARDIFFDMQSNNNNTVMGINATIKTFEHDKYSRKWPNIIVSDKQTIDKIDKIWDKLNIGSFIESPSKMYENIVLSKGAIIK